MTVQEHILDVSGLEPPEPLEQILSALEKLKYGEHLRVLHRREPFPLYAILNESGFAYETLPGKSTNYEILIRHRQEREGGETILTPKND